MEVIVSCESTKRGPYAGVIGYLDFSGNLDTAIAIRTMLITADGRASVQAGAGIVADSQAALKGVVPAQFDTWIAQFPKVTSLPADQQVIAFDLWDKNIGKK